MNYEPLKGKWNDVKPKIQTRWSKLNDADLKRIETNHSALAGILEQRYSLPKDKAEDDSKSFFLGVGAKQADVHKKAATTPPAAAKVAGKGDVKAAKTEGSKH